MIIKLFFCVLFCNVLFLQVIHGKTITGSIQANEDWLFLTRFCFSKNEGLLRFKIIYYMNSLNTSNNLRLLLYFDDQWPTVYMNYSKNCFQKEAVLRPENNQVIYLTASEGWTQCKVTENTMVVCEAERSFVTGRDRWWYVVASSCGTPLLKVDHFKITMLNGNDFDQHFSADEQTILEFDIALLIFISILCCFSFYASCKLSESRLLHMTYKLYITSLYFYFFFLLTYVISYAIYANNGLDNTAGKMIGSIFEACSILIFILMLLLLSKGFTITRSRMSPMEWFLIAIFMSSLSFSYIAVFIYQHLVFDPALVIYMYQSMPGVVLLGLRLACFIFFFISCIFTVIYNRKKTKFYVFIIAIYSTWFIGGFIVVVIANSVMQPWMREKVVNAIFGSVNAIAYSFMMFCSWPTNFNVFFPYHIKTNTVGAIETADKYRINEERILELFTTPSPSPHSESPKPLLNYKNLYPTLEPLKSAGEMIANKLNIFTITNK